MFGILNILYEVPEVFYEVFLKDLFRSKLRINLAVIGMTESGKTTLFDAIRNENRANEEGATDAVGVKLPEKVLEKKLGDKTIVISETTDYDGDRTSASNFKNLFKDSDIIIFVFNAFEFEKNTVNKDDERTYQGKFIAKLNAALKSFPKKEDKKFVLLLGSHKDKIESAPDKLKKQIYTLMRENKMEIPKGRFKIVFGNLTDSEWTQKFIYENIFKYYDK